MRLSHRLQDGFTGVALSGDTDNFKRSDKRLLACVHSKAFARTIWRASQTLVWTMFTQPRTARLPFERSMRHKAAALTFIGTRQLLYRGKDQVEITAPQNIPGKSGRRGQRSQLTPGPRRFEPCPIFRSLNKAEGES